MPLTELRNNIDKLDREIIKLLNQRYEYVKKVGEWKRENGQDIFVPEREKKLLEKLHSLNEGPMTDTILNNIYREIISGSYALEAPIRVAFLGPEASFTQIAAITQFGHSVEYVKMSSIADVFNEVEAGRVDYGCVPVENSTEGAVNHTLDMFLNSPANISAEINMRIHHNLLANCPKEDVKKIYSHVQAFAQCRNWIQQNLPHAEIVATSSTAKAAELAKHEENAAAIASTLAAEIHNLNILSASIEDNTTNTTRFMIISETGRPPTGDDKTSLCLGIRDRVGGLYECLKPFKEENIMLTMIESRPSKKKNWDYFFFIDIVGHKDDEHVKKVFAQLQDISSSFRVIGSYPRSVTIQ